MRRNIIWVQSGDVDAVWHCPLDQERGYGLEKRGEQRECVCGAMVHVLAVHFVGDAHGPDYLGCEPDEDMNEGVCVLCAAELQALLDGGES